MVPALYFAKSAEHKMNLAQNFATNVEQKL